MTKEQRSSDTWNKLSNGGPQPLEHSPSYTLRQDGLTRFNPRSRSAGDSLSGTGETTPVWYIEGKHDPRVVIEAWLDVNDDPHEDTSPYSIHSRICVYGGEWQEASKAVLGPFESLSNNGGEVDYGGDCPLCGEEYDHTLPKHLPGCDAA